MSLIQHLSHGEVEGIRVGRFTSQINTSVIVYRVGDAAIDAGPPNQWRFVRDFLQSRGVRRVLITHHHEDHSGNGATIRRELKIPVLAPELSIPYLSQGYPMQLYRRVIWGVPAKFRAETLPREVELAPGLSLHLLPASGHAPDMVCFLIPQRGWLFTADLFITPAPQFARKADHYREEMESLRGVLEHDFATVFCAHRGVVENGKEMLRRKLEYLEELYGKVGEMHRAGKSLREIRLALLGREGMMSWLTFFHFSRRNMIKSVL